MVWPLVIAGISAASSMLGSSSSRRQKRREQAAREKQFGTSAAGIDFSTARQQSLVPDQTKQITDNAQLAKIAIKQNQDQIEANMLVNAAAAGVSGTSIDVTIADSTRTAAENEFFVNKAKSRELQQLRINITDSAIQSEISKGRLVNNSGGDSRGADTAQAGLTFASSLLANLNSN